jgi:hypothetical protein
MLVSCAFALGLERVSWRFGRGFRLLSYGLPDSFPRMLVGLWCSFAVLSMRLGCAFDLQFRARESGRFRALVAQRRFQLCRFHAQSIQAKRKS